MAIRRKRIDRSKAERFFGQLAALRITFEPPLSISQAQVIFALSIKHKLTFYDAAYVDLVLRTALLLATLDGEMIDAARSEGVVLVP